MLDSLPSHVEEGNGRLHQGIESKQVAISTLRSLQGIFSPSILDGKKFSAGTRIVQPFALCRDCRLYQRWLSQRCLQVSHGGLCKPNYSGSGCLASEWYKDVYISPSK
jgi:hypothetical protein